MIKKTHKSSTSDLIFDVAKSVSIDLGVDLVEVCANIENCKEFEKRRKGATLMGIGVPLKKQESVAV
jgi:hypothetical protein